MASNARSKVKAMGFLLACASLSGSASAQSWKLATTLMREGQPTDDSFGWDASCSGDTILVGAPHEATIDERAGVAYALDGEGWSQVARLLPSMPAKYESIGSAVDIDGDRAILGTNRLDNSKVYIFERTDAGWVEQLRIFPLEPGPRNGSFGLQVAIEGDVALVASPKENGDTGAVHVYGRSNGTWSAQTVLVASDAMQQDFFAYSLDYDGETLVVGAPGNAFYATERAAAYVFVQRDGVWTQQARLTIEGDAVASPDVYFGASVSVDGDTIWVGAPIGADLKNVGRAVSFVRTGDQWAREQVIEHPDLEEFGSPVIVRGDTAWTVGGSGVAKAIYVYQREGGTWTERERIATAGIPRDACGGTLLVGNIPEASGGFVEVYRNPALDPADEEDEPSGGAPAGMAGAASDGDDESSSGCSAARSARGNALGWPFAAIAALGLRRRYARP